MSGGHSKIIAVELAVWTTHARHDRLGRVTHWKSWQLVPTSAQSLRANRTKIKAFFNKIGPKPTLEATRQVWPDFTKADIDKMCPKNRSEVWRAGEVTIVRHSRNGGFGNSAYCPAKCGDKPNRNSRDRSIREQRVITCQCHLREFGSLI